jgi:hypothetical membrane protein
MYSKGKVAGILFIAAATQFVLGLTISEALYPDYSISDNYISDLGVGSSSIIFNSSVFLLGLLLIIGIFYLRHISNFRIVNILLLLMALGAMGVGVFTEEYRVAHGAVAFIAFLCAGLSALASYKALQKPFSIISIILGAISLGALFLYSAGFITSGSLTSNIVYDSNFYLGLGPGGMERMIIYPTLMWITGLGGHLVTQ